MNILLVTHRLPFPPHDGAKVRAYQILRHLGARHRLSVACVDIDSTSPTHVGQLAEFCSRLSVVSIGRLRRLFQAATTLVTAEPVSFAYFRSKALANTVRAWHQEDPFDLVLGYSGCTEYYLEDLKGVCKVMDLVDLDSEKWMSYQRESSIPMKWVYGLEGRKTRAREKAIAESFDGVTVTTQAELADLRRLAPDARGEWFSNGVDAEFFRPTDQACDEAHLCFLGKMDYLPNVRACVLVARQVLPLVRRTHPNARFTIIGASPTDEVLALADLDGVTVTGRVEDVRPIAQTASCMVAPMDIARGVQNKLLEAMAMGIPVVTSSLAAKGVDARAGTDLLVADEPEAIAMACVRLIDDRAFREAVSVSARHRILQMHSWNHCLERFDRFVISHNSTERREAIVK